MPIWLGHSIRPVLSQYCVPPADCKPVTILLMTLVEAVHLDDLHSWMDLWPLAYAQILLHLQPSDQDAS